MLCFGIKLLTFMKYITGILLLCLLYVGFQSVSYAISDNTLFCRESKDGEFYCNGHDNNKKITQICYYDIDGKFLNCDKN